MRYHFIQGHRREWPTRLMCRTPEVSTGGFYEWRRRPAGAPRQRREALVAQIKAIHHEVKARYGSPRIHAELVARGRPCCLHTVAKLMNQAGVAAKTKRKFRGTTDSNHAHPVAENVVNRQFKPEAPDQVGTADITYISTREGWLYLAAVEDLHSRRIVGWSMGERVDSRLVVDALEMAVSRRLPGEGLVTHSDRGNQYASEQDRRILAGPGITCSMSRRANCWDNAPMESFLRLAEEGVGARRGLPDEGRSSGEPVRVHRGVLRPGPAALVAGLSVPRRVRASRITVNPVSANRGEVHKAPFNRRQLRNAAAPATSWEVAGAVVVGEGSGDDRLSRQWHYHGPGGLNGRVRDGNGWGPAGIVAGKQGRGGQASARARNRSGWWCHTTAGEASGASGSMSGDSSICRSRPRPLRMDAGGSSPSR